MKVVTVLCLPLFVQGSSSLLESALDEFFGGHSSESKDSSKSLTLVADFPSGISPAELEDTLHDMERIAESLFRGDEEFLGSIFKPSSPSVHSALGLTASSDKMMHRRQKKQGIPCACSKDIKRICAEEGDYQQYTFSDEKFGKWSHCLMENKDQLSTKCAMSLSQSQVIKSCSKDIYQHCNSVAPGYGRIHKCLLKQKSSLSESCVAYLFSKGVALSPQYAQQRSTQLHVNHVGVERTDPTVGNNDLRRVPIRNAHHVVHVLRVLAWFLVSAGVALCVVLGWKTWKSYRKTKMEEILHKEEKIRSSELQNMGYTSIML